jgi:hypothetical protein
MLYGRSGSAGNADPYKTAVIDTLVAEVQSTPGEDRCILLLVSSSQRGWCVQADKGSVFSRATKSRWRTCSG